MGGKYATLMRFWLARKRRAGAAARWSSFAIDGVASPPAAPIVVHRLRVARARELFDRGRRPLCGCRRRARSACRRRHPHSGRLPRSNSSRARATRRRCTTIGAAGGDATPSIAKLLQRAAAPARRLRASQNRISVAYLPPMRFYEYESKALFAKRGLPLAKS